MKIYSLDRNPNSLITFISKLMYPLKVSGPGSMLSSFLPWRCQRLVPLNLFKLYLNIYPSKLYFILIVFLNSEKEQS